MALRMLEQCRISLSPEFVPRPPLPLTMFDIPWLSFKPVDRLFFYRLPLSTTDFFETHLPNLKSSLLVALNIFYPLAGAIHQCSGSFDRFELRYTVGDSISFEVYEHTCMDFYDISGHHARPFHRLKELAPLLPKPLEAQQLLAVKVTLFPKQGLCLAVSIHHAACDGFSSIHFLKFWAATAAHSPPPPLPSFDRSTISNPRNLNSKLASLFLFKTPSPTSPPPPQPHTSSTLTAASFTLPSTQIQNLKLKLHSTATKKGFITPPFHISTFVVSTACAWISHVKFKGYDLGRKAHLLFPVNCRSRMVPLPPANYFGNCLGCPCFVNADVSEIVAEEDGFFVACERIGRGIGGLGDMDVYEGMERIFDKFMEVVPWEPLSIAGSPRMLVYGADFGWGRPEKVELLSIGESGAISMAESGDDGGGVEIGVVLERDEIDEFGKEFRKFQEECVADDITKPNSDVK